MKGRPVHEAPAIVGSMKDQSTKPYREVVSVY